MGIVSQGRLRGSIVEKLTSILVVVSRTATDRMLLEKAVSLARHVGAEIHLFSCDAQLARRLRHSYPTEEAEKAWNICLAEHLAYLRRLRAGVFAPGVAISVDAACHSPLHEGIVARVRDLRPDLVMKAPAGEHPLRRLALDSTEWQLTKACPTTLMLVRSHLWRSLPKLAAFVDVSEEDTARFAQAIVHTSEYFSLGCHGALDVVYSERSADDREKSEHLVRLERLTREYHVEASRVTVLNGAPQDVLPDFATQQGYDAIVLGALTHRKGIAGVRATLTSRIADAVDCDLILVPCRDHELIATDDSGVARDCVPLADSDVHRPPAATASPARLEAMIAG
jgi:universal stress protein E